MRVLVTGVAGFIGMNLSRRLLARGDSVIGIDSLNDYYDVQLKRDRLAELERLGGDRFTFRQVDFADHAALDEALAGQTFERIAHLGAQAGVRYSIENPRAYVQANLVGHLNLLEVARHRGVEHMVYASSSSVYGGNTQMPFSVDDRVDHPLSLYAATKKADELMSETYAHLYRLPLTGLRFFTVYGPWGRPDMAYYGFARAIAAGEPITLYDGGRLRRDFTYIDDIVAGVVGALDRPVQDARPPVRVLNIGNSGAEEVRTLVALLESELGRKAIVRDAPRPLADVEATFASVDAIAELTGFTPRTCLADGIPRFVAWFRKWHGV